MSKFFICLMFSAVGLLASEKANAMGMKLNLTRSLLSNQTSLGYCKAGGITLADATLEICPGFGKARGVTPEFEGSVNVALISKLAQKDRIGTCRYSRTYTPTGQVLFDISAPKVSLTTCGMIYDYLYLSLASSSKDVQNSSRINVTFDTH